MRADRQDEEPEVHILDRLILNPIKFIYNKLFCKNNIQPTHKPSLSFEHAYAQMKHIAPKSKPQLDNEDTTDDSVDNDASLIRGANGINMFIDEQMQEHKQKVLDKDDLVEMQATNDKFLKILLSRPRASNHGIFANHAGCYAPNAEPGVLNRVLPVH